MTISYDKGRDYAEVSFNKEENYGENVTNTVMAFKSEKSYKVVGYTF